MASPTRGSVFSLKTDFPALMEVYMDEKFELPKIGNCIAQAFTKMLHLEDFALFVRPPLGQRFLRRQIVLRIL